MNIRKLFQIWTNSIGASRGKAAPAPELSRISDLRLQRKFEEIKREERTLVKLILMS